MDILRANFKPAKAWVALALPNRRVPLELVLVQQLFELICGASGKGQTILLVEQNADGVAGSQAWLRA